MGNDNALRSSGIGLIGKIPWGTHLCQLYSSQQDYYGVVVPYIKAGLENNELCVWIYKQDTGYLEIIGMLKKGITNLEKYLKDNQLLVTPDTEWYLKDNSFNEVRVITQWKKLVKQAVDKGFNGLRAAGDTSWLEKNSFICFLHYEHSINNAFADMPVLVLCLYDANKLDTFEIADIISSHNYILTKRKNSLELIKNSEFNKDKQLAESEKKYNQLVCLLPDSVFVHDKERIFYYNEPAARMTGASDQKELIGKSMLELVESDNKNRFISFVNDAISGFNDQNFLISKFVCQNGEIRDVEINSAAYYYKGHPALLSVVRDITAINKVKKLEEDLTKNRRLLDESLENDKLKTEFFANISHELRTPLNVILAALQLLKLEGKPSFQNIKDALKTVQQNCFRLLRLINNIIDITKIDSNYFEVKFENYDIVNLVESITSSVVDYAENKGVTIIFDTNIEEKVIACDPDQIERIVLNLLSNAIKFTPSGGCIWVTTQHLKDRIKISIKDTGIGIPLDKQEYIFDRFQQVDKSLTRANEGSGIGLSLVKALVEKHDGKITLTSELGKGSEFLIDLPCKLINDSKQKQLVESPQYDNSRIQRISIELSDIYS